MTKVEFSPRMQGWFDILKINACGLLYSQTKREKPHNHLSSAENAFDRIWYPSWHDAPEASYRKLERC